VTRANAASVWQAGKIKEIEQKSDKFCRKHVQDKENKEAREWNSKIKTLNEKFSKQADQSMAGHPPKY
jgi:hypothetical protein